MSETLTKVLTKKGRKSAYLEKANAEMLASLFFMNINSQELKDKITSGNYSIAESFIQKALEGSQAHQIAIFNKLFPDQSKIQFLQAPDISYG